MNLQISGYLLDWTVFSSAYSNNLKLIKTPKTDKVGLFKKSLV